MVEKKTSLKTNNERNYVGITQCDMNNIVGIKIFEHKTKNEVFKLRYVLKTKLYILSIKNIETNEEEVFVETSYLKLLLELYKSNKHDNLREVLKSI